MDFFEKRIELEKNIIEEASCIISLSETEKNDLQEFYNAPAEKIIVIPGGVNLKQFHPLEKERAREKEAYEYETPTEKAKRELAEMIAAEEAKKAGGYGIYRPEPESKAKTRAKEIENIRNLLTNYGQRDYVDAGYYSQVKANSSLSPSEFDKRFGYLKKEEVPDWFRAKIIKEYATVKKMSPTEETIRKRWNKEVKVKETFGWEKLTPSQKHNVLGWMAKLKGFASSDIKKMDTDPEFADYMLAQYYQQYEE